LNLKAITIMKRSKIFLAGTACLLAIVGVAASKAHFGNFEPVYTSSVANGPCVIPIVGVQGFTQAKDGTSLQLGYSFNASSCRTPLYDTGE